jgi:hypothetical protein
MANRKSQIANDHATRATIIPDSCNSWTPATPGLLLSPTLARPEIPTEKSGNFGTTGFVTGFDLGQIENGQNIIQQCEKPVGQVVPAVYHPPGSSNHESRPFALR